MRIEIRMFTLRQLEFAVAIAEEGSFTAAAERCHTVQSALSHQVARLEALLGARLFERGARQVRPTAAGQVFLAGARDTLRAAQRLQDEMAQAAGVVRGRLQIGLISSLVAVPVPALLGDFRAAYPQVDVHMRTGMSEAMLADVAEGRLDVALVGVGPQVALPEQRLRLHEEGLALLVAPGHPLAAAAPVPLAALDDMPLVGLIAGSGVRGITDAAFAAAGLRQRIQYEATHGELIRQLVAAGLGAALLPQTMAEAMREVAVVPLAADFRFLTYACWGPDPTPAARAVVELLLRACLPA